MLLRIKTVSGITSRSQLNKELNSVLARGSHIHYLYSDKYRKLDKFKLRRCSSGRREQSPKLCEKSHRGFESFPACKTKGKS